MQPEILLLSSYDIDSHQRWRKGLVAQFEEYQWTELALPPRYFRWRIRGNPISWYLDQHQVLKKPYDLVIATSMVDIATLRGLFPQLSQIPLLVYFHENQLAFPHSEKQHASIDPAMVNIYSAIAADAVVFNSKYNRQSFLDGLHTLINKLPDLIDHRLADIIDRKSSVLCVPLEDHLMAANRTSLATSSLPAPFVSALPLSDRSLPTTGHPLLESHVQSFQSREQAIHSHEQKFPSPTEQPDDLRILWNHRVEYDKGVDDFFELLLRLNNTRLRFNLILLGQRFRRIPASWLQLSERFADRIVINEFAASRDSYNSWVQLADVVVSTAIHEFQGLAVMEACAMGCVPLVPDRLSYPEFFAKEYRYQNLDQAVDWLMQRQDKQQQTDQILRSPDMQQLSWQRQRSVYHNLISSLLSKG